MPVNAVADYQWKVKEGLLAVETTPEVDVDEPLRREALPGVAEPQHRPVE